MSTPLQRFLCIAALSLAASFLNIHSILADDSGLTVQAGLVVRLSADHGVETTESREKASADSGPMIHQWTDQSSIHRNFVQPDRDAQPKLLNIDGQWCVRFDGESDYLRNVAPKESKAMTLFVVAAPYENLGEFRGLISANAPGQRDYVSGFNFDMGPGPSRQLDMINIEGRGFSGAVDLLDQSYPFGRLHTFEFSIDPTTKQLHNFVDGKRVGTRGTDGSSFSLEELTLGARFYTNGPGPQMMRGPTRCDIAEVLLYDRILSANETAAVREYLAVKYKKLAESIPQYFKQTTLGQPLVKVPEPPLVQMLLPGFRIQTLPIEITNVNSVHYREDGKLVTLGYNGDIHLLSDTDGDGVEDHAEVFYKNSGGLRGPIGLQWTPKGHPAGNGAFVPSKGKVSLIVDTDGDDRADKEIIVADGWQEIVQNVDAVGLAVDKEGYIYFGLGTTNYANAYLIDAEGKSEYRLESERGTIQRVSPDFKTRETVCTGVRFPIGIAFNSFGDLFCTDQEGATWLPNGNPLDELLFIERNRHYGFPPRHPVHNPNVIDEPSVFDYGPQHQSTCGLRFNQVAPSDPRFGPAAWAGDAIVCGESRGKLWRTKLFKTDSGYVATSQLLACLQMLTVDATVAPNGDLVVACHSGPPDWGTGPAGIGKLFRISALPEPVSRPLFAWSESPSEIRIAFDGPVDPTQFKEIVSKGKIEFGSFVRAGDRFENLAPPYAVVQRQSVSPRMELPIASTSITPDLRTMILQTAKTTSDVHFALTLPVAAGKTESQSKLNVPQHPEIDLDWSMHGVRASWIPSHADGQTIWIPHLDLQVAKHFTASSKMHESFWDAVKGEGVLTLETQLDLHHLLRPAIQPGATIDYEWPAETVSLEIRSNVPLKIQSLSIGSIQSKQDGIEYVSKFDVSGDGKDWVDLKLQLEVRGGSIPSLSVAAHTNEDPRGRALQAHRFKMPWVSPKSEVGIEVDNSKLAELEGGSWGRGRRVFQSEAAGCFKCHALQGVGAKIGPDLANLVFRDYGSVMRDILQPSFAINPEYIGHNVLLKDGTTMTGVLRDENGRLMIGDANGKLEIVPRDEIDQMKPAQQSVMPTGLLDKLSKEQVRDLLTYLLTPPPSMPIDSPIKAPPVRTQADVAKALAGSIELKSPIRPLDIVLVAGPKDHGPSEHDYPAWQVRWAQLLSAAEGTTVSTAWEFPSDEQIAKADLLVFFQKGAWNAERAKKLDPFLARGGGAVYFHWAVNGDDASKEFAQRIGLASHGGMIRFRHGPLQLQMHNTDHPILRNFDQIDLYDESYWLLSGDPSHVTLLASSVEDGQATPQLWVTERNGGRIFVSIPGHYSWTFDDPLFRIIALRGIAWSAKEPVDRFNELVTPGARMKR